MPRHHDSNATLAIVGAVVVSGALAWWLWKRRQKNHALIGADALRAAEGYMDGFDLLGAA